MAYIQGKYRGVPFFTEEASHTFGRKTAIYQLPLESRGVAHLDLGRAPREFSLTCIYVGANYAAQRDAMITALETPGSGRLEHPYIGTAIVVLKGPVTVKESTAEGRKCTISLEFIEARESSEPVPDNDSSAFAIEKTTALRSAGAVAIERGMAVNAIPDFVRLSNIAVVDEIIAELTLINGAIGSALAVPSHYAHQLDQISQQVSTLIGTPTLLYNAIDTTVASMYASIRRVKGSSLKQIGNLSDVIAASAALGLASEVPPDSGTEARDTENTNRSALIINLQASALASAAQAAVETEYASAQDAENIMITLVDALSNLSDRDVNGVEPDQEVYDAIRDLIGAVTAHLKQTAGSLAEVTTHRPADVLPALVLAYQLYGDANRADEILERNPQIVHPSFIPALEDLEVLNS